MKKIPWLHILLFLLTFLSTLAVGVEHAGVSLLTVLDHPENIFRGFPFSVTLLVILLAHEFSHYYFSKRNHVEATLPYFIPAPTLFGTLGAFIKMKSPITTKNALMDIGASGPIAGFLVSLAAVVVGLSLSSVSLIDKQPGVMIFGDSLLFTALTKIILGALPAEQDVLLHPIAFAGWIGFFVTAMNLLPIGQLDGGHIAYALLGSRHHLLSKILIGVLVLLGVLVFEGWIVWAVLLVVLGTRHPAIMEPYIPLDGRRKAAGIISLLIFVVTFIPVPITIL